MALLAFWVLEVSTFIFILFALEYIAGGHMFPLDILPPVIERLVYLTPFPYQMYFPVSIYLGQTTGPDLWQGMATQAGWVVATFVLARVVWARGLKRYSAVGG
jgi:ABC-2 type transport system permease protein